MTTTHDTLSLSPGLPPADADTVNANDVRRFVYTWFTLFEHRAPAEQFVKHLSSTEPFKLAFPGGQPLNTAEQFVEWHSQLLANTEWNFHELSKLTIEAQGDGTFSAAFDVDWQGVTAEGSVWPTNLPERAFRFALRQRWLVASHPGAALDDSFHLVDLVAEPR